jgi:RNA polymerase sigma-70 factor (ECF subfamily)
VLGAEVREQIGRAIAALPSPQREVIVLRDVEGWSADEVCEALELSPGNQRVLLHRARAKARQALEDLL